MAAFVIDFWNKDLKEHFEAEEQILIPAMNNTSFDKSLNDQLLQEHALIRSYIGSMNNADKIPSIKAFTELLEKHIRFEERIFFPEVEKILSQDQLQKIGEQLKEEEEKNCMNYPIRFWE
jgi:hemerythrin-like domain-containing protein